MNSLGKDHPYSELRDKIIAGNKLAFERLVEETISKNGYLVFSENGKVVKVDAHSLKTIFIDKIV